MLDAIHLGARSLATTARALAGRLEDTGHNREVAAFVVDANGAQEATIRLSSLAHLGTQDPQTVATVLADLDGRYSDIRSAAVAVVALLDAVISCLLT